MRSSVRVLLKELSLQRVPIRLADALAAGTAGFLVLLSLYLWSDWGKGLLSRDVHGGVAVAVIAALPVLLAGAILLGASVAIVIALLRLSARRAGWGECDATVMPQPSAWKVIFLGSTLGVTTAVTLMLFFEARGIRIQVLGGDALVTEWAGCLLLGLVFALVAYCWMKSRDSQRQIRGRRKRPADGD